MPRNPEYKISGHSDILLLLTVFTDHFTNEIDDKPNKRNNCYSSYNIQEYCRNNFNSNN